MNTKLKTIIIFLVLYVHLLFFQSLRAQSWASNFHYFQNTPTYNAAYAGIKNTPSANINYHHFKAGLVNNLVEVGFQTQLNNKPIGLGLLYKRDVYNQQEINDFEGQFAYHFQLQEKIRLAGGIKLGVQQYYLDLTNLQAGDPSNAIFVNDYFLKVGLGTLLYSKKYFVGISLHNIINQKLNTESLFEDEVKYKNLYFSAGIIFNEQSNFALRPSALFNLNFRSIKGLERFTNGERRYTGFVEVSIDALLYKTLWLGASFEPSKPLKLHTKIDIKQQFSLLGYWQIIENLPYLEKSYFFGVGLQAHLSKVNKEIPQHPYF